MNKSIVINSCKELEVYKRLILDNLERCKIELKKIIEVNNGIEIFKEFKFSKSVI